MLQTKTIIPYSRKQKTAEQKIALLFRKKVKKNIYIQSTDQCVSLGSIEGDPWNYWNY